MSHQGASPLLLFVRTATSPGVPFKTLGKNTDKDFLGVSVAGCNIKGCMYQFLRGSVYSRTEFTTMQKKKKKSMKSHVDSLFSPLLNGERR